MLLREDIPGEPRLVGYVVGDAEQLGADTLRTQLAARLPDYMLPAAYVQLKVLPVNTNGKLDRRTLPAPEAATPANAAYVPPATPIERRLAKLWASVLGTQRIGRNDHFFELGGHSLSVVRLIAAARRSHFELTVQMVYAAPTLQAQAARLSGDTQAFGSQVLAARRHGSRPPVFVVPTGIGDITYAFELAGHLDADIPVYALPWPEPLPATMDALATQMAAWIQAVQPHGPYHLLGYSSGGLLSYAIAQHFDQQGQSVAFLGLLDCSLPTAKADTDTLDTALGQALLQRLDGLRHHEPYQERHDVQAALEALLKHIGDNAYADMAAACESDPMLAQLAAEEQTTVANMLQECVNSTHFNRLWPAFTALPLQVACKLHLFQASEPEPATDAYGWQHLLPAAQIARMPVGGNHVTMIENMHIVGLAHCIEQALDRASPACTSSTPHAAPAHGDGMTDCANPRPMTDTDCVTAQVTP